MTDDEGKEDKKMGRAKKRGMWEDEGNRGRERRISVCILSIICGVLAAFEGLIDTAAVRH